MTIRSHRFGKNRYRIYLDDILEGLAIVPGPEREYEIHINANLKGKRLLEVTVHEGMHACFPAMEENGVDAAARDLTEFLWRLGYRRTGS